MNTQDRCRGKNTGAPAVARAVRNAFTLIELSSCCASYGVITREAMGLSPHLFRPNEHASTRSRSGWAQLRSKRVPGRKLCSGFMSRSAGPASDTEWPRKRGRK